MLGLRGRSQYTDLIFTHGPTVEYSSLLPAQQLLIWQAPPGGVWPAASAGDRGRSEASFIHRLWVEYAHHNNSLCCWQNLAAGVSRQLKTSIMAAHKPQSQKVQFLEIDANQAGQRIDNFLLSLEKGVPKSRIYRALRKGEVRVNKGRIKQTYKLQPGDLVRVPPLRVSEKNVPDTISDSLREALLANILFEDDSMLVINKPSGLAVHAGSQIQLGLIEALRVIKPEQDFLELVHRLDRDTSGCLMVAKSRESLLKLQQQMQSDEIDKRYLTLLKGNLASKEELVEQSLQKNTLSSGERMVVIDPAGKKAKTLFLQQQQLPLAQLTEVKLYTGRTHQIRVHSAWLGHPVAGDDKYGDREFNKTLKNYGLKRLFLHAWRLGIRHPLTNESMQLEAPLPENLKTVIDKLQSS